MKKLQEYIEQHDADIIPATPEQIEEASKLLNISFSKEYTEYLLLFGVISYEAWETYGLGIEKNSYLNLLTAVDTFREDANFPNAAVPLMDIGDGHYYIYDNKKQTVLVWATPGGAIQQTLDEPLEEFLIDTLFK